MKKRGIWMKEQEHNYIYHYHLLRYYTYYKDKQYHAYTDGFEEEDIVEFSSKKKEEVKKKMKQWFQSVVDNDEFFHYDDLKYYMHEIIPDFFEDVRSNGTGFHISEHRNFNSITSNGLIPKINADRDVDLASKELDKMKPSWIPEWVKRREAVYFHPSMNSYHITSCDITSSDIYAVDLTDKQAWVGSQGLGGFCLFCEDFNEKQLQSHIQNIHEEYGKDYWNYSCSFSNFISHSRRVKKKDHYAGLDEVLIFESIPKEKVIHIGHWDEHSRFFPTEHFQTFVRSDKQKQYQTFLDFIQKRNDYLTKKHHN